ncbi:phosphatase PAP2 family protein [Haloarcula sp. S1AR25-5A]|uniref:Phosphatase PAP2 family protein n=1 Tax=Haloarcula terrestris TaxID=2950533 RepID=A0AAE4EYN6_9EURY|nr:phosphatase PAP2 family protein [Haloarcula terrestris]MDS0222342.1 phosphatase PAP2 family protein [Haloarcula terrestris]
MRAQILAEFFDLLVRIDTATMDAIVAARTPLMTKVLTSVTGLGSATAALCFVGVCYLADWDEAFRHSLVALSITGVIVGTLMLTVQRPFPADPVCLTDGAETVSTSFPSGHAAAVTVYAMTARKSDALPFGAVVVLATLVAISRIYLGTHYLTDTVVGVGIGVAAFLLSAWLLDRAS